MALRIRDEKATQEPVLEFQEPRGDGSGGAYLVAVRTDLPHKPVNNIVRITKDGKLERFVLAQEFRGPGLIAVDASNRITLAN